MEPHEYDILSLLPQRPPFVMAERLEQADGNGCRTSFTVREDNILVEDGCLSEAGVMENIAQSCAARIGYESLRTGNEIKLGVIGAVRNLHLHRLPKVGECLSTHIAVEQEIFSTTLVRAQVFAGEECIAECEMKIATIDDTAKNKDI